MRIALLISGGGTTAEAIIRATKAGRLTSIEITCVIASGAEARPPSLRSGVSGRAGGIERAKKAGAPEKDVLVLSPKSFPSREEFGEAIIKECRARGVDFVGQYGWLVKTPENVVAAFEGRIVNQHPGPLDPGRLDFGGKGMFGRRVHAARLFFVRAAKRDFWTEATAHRVVAEYDKGAVLCAKRVSILESDTPETLAARALPVEHEVQIETLAMFAKGEVQEIKREMPLVFPGEEKILEEAKRKAMVMFPNG
ncbi:MAG: phosphoribosylglycinamide formyltransferase [Candidatus Liptonbacteria bacterium]|nr:phosphoribosylglycinamide formyltransferase [Candidatus Liptonbacteria bacterium]